MSLLDLDDSERVIVGQCLRAATEGPFFPEWEFQTLIGIPRHEVRNIAAVWPTVDAATAGVVVVGVLNNLTGYPHGMESEWGSYIGAAPSAVEKILKKILAANDVNPR